MTDEVTQLLRELAQKDHVLATALTKAVRNIPDPPPPPTPEQIAANQALLAEAEGERLVEKKLLDLRATERAKRALAEEEFKAAFTPPTIYASAGEGFAVPREPVPYGIDRLVKRGGNVLVTAGFKTGKTDLAFNILRSYADDVPFLGEFDVLPMDEGRKVVMLDFELDEDYAWEIFGFQGVKNLDRANLINFRGRAFNLAVDSHREWLTKGLVEMGCQILIVDPFGAAFKGEENSNSEVNAWLGFLDQVKEAAGIREVIMTIHTGRGQVEEGQERARGATRLNDWADVNWTYTRDDQPGTATPKNRRFLRAMGRAVDLDEISIDWAQDSHHLTVVEGGGNRSATRRTALQAALMAFLKDNPKSSTAVIKQMVEGKASSITEALVDMSSGDSPLLDVEPGARNAKLYSLSGAAQWALSKGQ